MPRLPLKLHDNMTENDYYLEWSTIVDAPTTGGFEWGTFQALYQQCYAEYPERMARLDAVRQMTREEAEEIIASNRAGPRESELTYEELLDRYCRRG